MKNRFLVAAAACALAVSFAVPALAVTATINASEGQSAVTGSAETSLSAHVPSVTLDQMDAAKPFGTMTVDITQSPEAVAAGLPNDAARMELQDRCSLVVANQDRFNSSASFCQNYVTWSKAHS